jgi:DNA-binding MarR family transcriptional regulator
MLKLMSCLAKHELCSKVFQRVVFNRIFLPLRGPIIFGGLFVSSSVPPLVPAARPTPAAEAVIVQETLRDLPSYGRIEDIADAPIADYVTLANFRHALRRYMAESERVAVEAGLTAQRYQALLAIRIRTPSDPISVGELAKHLVIRPHSAAELVARLENAELIRRKEDPSDRRRVLLSVSDEGNRRLATIAELQLRELAEHRQTFSRLVELLPA